MPGVPLRERLFALAAVVITPVVVMAGIGLYALQGQQRAQAEEVGLELARSVANAVDAELRGAERVLETLATTPSLDSEGIDGFHERASRLLGVRSDWQAIVLEDVRGRTLASAGRAASTPAAGERASFDRVVRTAAPVVGALTRDASGAWVFAVRVPVIRGGAVRYVLTALVRPEAIRDVLTRQNVPADWVISIVDGSGHRVARSRAHEENLGGRLSESVQQVVGRGGVEGIGVAYALEGEQILAPYSRFPTTDWIAVLGLPTEVADAAMYRAVAIFGGGIVLSLALGGLGAMWVARTITRPIADLRIASEALGRGETPEVPRTSIHEIRAVGAALTTAAHDRRKGELEREHLLVQERRARESAESADRAKDEFMAVLSHELRTPLNAVYGWAKMLQADQLRDEASIARAKDAIVRNAHAQMQLIDDLLDLSRITTGKLRLDVRPVELPGVLSSAVDAVRPAAEAKGIRIRAELDPLSEFIIGDPARLQQVAWNLLMNAVKFTPRGGEVHLRLRQIESQVELTVSDTGQGIAPDLLPHVFERFRQADSSSTRRHGGLGLGLALVKHLVELHGGRVTARSAGEGRGATFTVTLPTGLADSAHVPVPPARRRDDADDARGTSRLDQVRIVLVDDDPEGLGLADAILTRAGAEVRTCRTASDALELVRRWRPDVLVSDIEMPDEDGYMLIRKVRALEERDGRTTPAIALTAYGNPHNRERSLAAGFNMHVPKPVDPGELTTIVAGMTGRFTRPRTTT